MLSADINTEPGREVIKFLVAVAERTALQALATFHLPQTFAEALRLLADTTEANERLKLENAQVAEERDQEALTRLVAEKEVEEAKVEVEELLASLDRPEVVPQWSCASS